MSGASSAYYAQRTMHQRRRPEVKPHRPHDSSGPSRPEVSNQWVTALDAFEDNPSPRLAAEFIKLVARKWKTHKENILKYNNAYAEMIRKIEELASAGKSGHNLEGEHKASPHTHELPVRTLRSSLKKTHSSPHNVHEAGPLAAISLTQNQHSNRVAASLASEQVVRDADKKQQASLKDMCALFVEWRCRNMRTRINIMVLARQARNDILAQHRPKTSWLPEEIKRLVTVPAKVDTPRLSKLEYTLDERAVIEYQKWSSELTWARRNISVGERDARENISVAERDAYRFARDLQWEFFEFDAEQTIDAIQRRKLYDLAWTDLLESLHKNMHLLHTDFQQEAGVLNTPSYNAILPRPWATEHLYDTTWRPNRATSHFEGDHIETYRALEKHLTGAFINLSRQSIFDALQALEKIWNQIMSKSWAIYVTGYEERYKELIKAVDEVYKADLLPSKHKSHIDDPSVAKMKTMATELASEQERRQTARSNLQNFWKLGRNKVAVTRLRNALDDVVVHPAEDQRGLELETFIKGHKAYAEHLLFCAQFEDFKEYLEERRAPENRSLDLDMHWEHRLYKRRDHIEHRSRTGDNAELHQMIQTIYDGIELPFGVHDDDLVPEKRPHRSSSGVPIQQHNAHADHSSAGSSTRPHSTDAHDRSVRTVRHVP